VASGREASSCRAVLRALFVSEPGCGKAPEVDFRTFPDEIGRRCMAQKCQPETSCRPLAVQKGRCSFTVGVALCLVRAGRNCSSGLAAARSARVAPEPRPTKIVVSEK